MLAHDRAWTTGASPRLEAGPEATRVEPRNPTTYGAFNDQEMEFWSGAFWKPSDLSFHEEEKNCKRLFQRRLKAARIKAQHTGMPSGRQLNARSQKQ